MSEDRMTWREVVDRHLEPLALLAAALAVCATVYGVVVADNRYHDAQEQRIAQVVAGGVDPITARCGLRLSGDDSHVCMVRAAMPGRAP